MPRTPLGGIDDPIWTSNAPTVTRTARGSRPLHLAMGTFTLGIVVSAVIVHGFDWVSLVGAAGVVACGFLVAYRSIGGALIVGALVVMVTLAALEAVNAMNFHTFRLDGAPPKLHWCGRDYLLGSPESRAPLAGLAGATREVLIAPSGTAVYSNFACGPGVPTVLEAPVNGGRWVSYSLSGGP